MIAMPRKFGGDNIQVKEKLELDRSRQNILLSLNDVRSA
jgi:hypothetical protein